MPDIFNSILNGTTGLGTFLICIISSVIFGILISIVYILTHRKESYSQNYVMSIIMLPGIVSLIILLINDTSKALGLAGAFSLVRFRSVPGRS